LTQSSLVEIHRFFVVTLKKLKKVNFNLEQTIQAQREREREMYISTLSLTSVLDRGGWSTPQPDNFTPGKDPVPILQGAGWVPLGRNRGRLKENIKMNVHGTEWGGLDLCSSGYGQIVSFFEYGNKP
jgi:hypothetical protein